MIHGYDLNEDEKTLGNLILLNRIKNALEYAKFNSIEDTTKAVKYINEYIKRFEKSQKNVDLIIDREESLITFLHNYFDR